ncbi:hypothetical protein [Saccharopolyspora spinosa]|nr:hypothetical protein [Saccharopolyspora spinosa]
MAMVTAVETSPGTDPDRASFTTALETARDQLTAACGICPAGPVDLLGAIGRAVLDTLLPTRRPRYSARKLKSSTSRYHHRDDDRPEHTTTITAIDIALHAPNSHPAKRNRRQSPTRRDRVTAIMNTGPHRAWHGRQLAEPEVAGRFVGRLVRRFV